MQRIDLVLDAETAVLWDDLKSEFNCKSDADLARKLLAFADICAENADENGVVHMRGQNADNGVNLSLRT